MVWVGHQPWQGHLPLDLEEEVKLRLPLGYCFCIFKCTCLNEASFLFLVLFAVPPTIKSSGPSERAVVLHKPVTLQCIASGIPSPSITWLKDGQPVNTARGNIRVSMILSWDPNHGR